MISSAVISGSVGLALLRENGNFFVVSVNDPTTFRTPERNEIRFFLEFSSELLEIECDIEGLRKEFVSEKLVQEYNKHQALSWFLRGLDRLTDGEVRIRSLKRSNQLMTEIPVFQFVANRVLSRSLPQAFDLSAASMAVSKELKHVHLLVSALDRGVQDRIEFAIDSAISAISETRLQYEEICDELMDTTVIGLSAFALLRRDRKFFLNLVFEFSEEGLSPLAQHCLQKFGNLLLTQEIPAPELAEIAISSEDEGSDLETDQLVFESVHDQIMNILQCAHRDEAFNLSRSSTDSIQQVIGNSVDWVLNQLNKNRLIRAENATRDLVERLVPSSTATEVCKTLTRIANAVSVETFPTFAFDRINEAEAANANDVVVHSSRARLFLLTGDLPEAERLYRETLDRFPGGEVARNGLAEVLKQKGDLGGAEQVYQKTIDLFPGNEVARNGLAEVLKQKGDLVGAEQVYQKTIDLIPSDVFARCGLAEVLKQKGDLVGAEQFYQKTIDLFPGNEVARNGLAEVLKQKGDLVGAEQVYQKTIDLIPSDVFARCGLAEVLKQKGDLVGAEQFYQKTIDLFPGNEVARNGLAEVLKQKGDLVGAEQVYQKTIDLIPSDVFARCGLAEVLKQKGDLVGAEQFYQKTIDLFPGNEVARNGLAEVLKQKGDLVGAEQVYQKTIDLIPSDVFARCGLAEVLKQKGDLVGAEQFYQKTIDLFPGNEVARNGLAEVLKQKGDLVGAEQVYQKTIDLIPSDVFARCGLAEVLKQKGDLVGAEQVYQKTIDLFPGNEVARNGLAEVLKQKGDLVGAEQVYQKTIDLIPSDVFARCGLAEVLKQKGDLVGAEQFYQKTIDLFPGNEVARNGLAEVLKQKGDLVGAEQVYQKTIDLIPSDVFARCGLAEVLKQKGDLVGAEQFYQKTIDLFPGNVFARCGLAEVLKQKGDLVGAKQLYEKTMDLFPGNEVARNGLTVVLKQMRLLKEALDLLDDRTEINSMDAWIGTHIKGCIFMSQDKMVEAIEVFRAGVEENPFIQLLPRFLTSLACAELRGGDNSGSRITLKKAKSMYLLPVDDAKVIFLNARMHAATSRNREAERELTKDRFLRFEGIKVFDDARKAFECRFGLFGEVANETYELKLRDAEEALLLAA